MTETREKRAKENHDTIIRWIKDWFKDKTDLAVLGISGGKDSTVCAALLAEALGPDRVIGVMMPNGVQVDIKDSKKVIEFLGIKGVEVNIVNAYNALSNAIDINNLTKSTIDCKAYITNTPARLRMTTLYGIAALCDGFVCCTCNLSEDWVGYSTKYGDAAGDFALLNNLTKTEVVELGEYMSLPSYLIHKTPSDGMCGKSDEDNMGFTYETLDKYIIEGLPPKSLEIKMKIDKMHNNPNTKLKLIPMPSPAGLVN